MAHQTENIPWQDLANILRPEFYKYGCGKTSRLVTCGTKEEWCTIADKFCTQFAKCVKEQASHKRKKYPKIYRKPLDDEVVLNDETVARILPTMRRMMGEKDENNRYWLTEKDSKLSSLEDIDPNDNSMPFISLWRRKMHAFFDEKGSNRDCYDFPGGNSDCYFQLEILISLLVHNEMDAVLRISCHEKVDYRDWKNEAQCDCGLDYTAGWDRLYIHALKSYILLNLLCCFPHMKQEAQRSPKTDHHDYRDLKQYQSMWYTYACAKEASDIPFYLHQDFLAIPAERRYCKVSESKFGTMSFQQLVTKLTFDTAICVTSPKAIKAARAVLRSKGLPRELQDNVIQYLLLYDPLHQDNRPHLIAYLDVCWRIILNCDMMAEAIDIYQPGPYVEPEDVAVDWKSEVIGLFHELFGLSSWSVKTAQETLSELSLS